MNWSNIISNLKESLFKASIILGLLSVIIIQLLIIGTAQGLSETSCVTGDYQKPSQNGMMLAHVFLPLVSFIPEENLIQSVKCNNED